MRVVEHARKECKDRNEYKIFCHSHPLGEFLEIGDTQIDI